MSTFIFFVQLLFCLPIIETGEDRYGFEGGTVMFICPFKGNEKYDLYWNKVNNLNITTVLSINDRINNQTVEPGLFIKLSIIGNNNTGEYKLQIHDIRESDEGRYMCNVQIQQDIQTLYLIVPPSGVSIENTTANRLTGAEGYDLTVSCVAVGGKPPPNVILTVGMTPLFSGIQTATYRFLSINRTYDRHTVLCESSNEANVKNPNMDSALLYLNLKPLQPIFSPDPEGIEETRPLVVSCKSSGSRPPATFKWMIGPAIITSDITTTTVLNTADDTYTVTSTLTYIVNRTYTGRTLTCGAYNSVSTSGVVHSTTLDVKFAPDIAVQNVTYNQNTATRTVTCKPLGNPITYTYYRWQHKSSYGVLIRELDGGQDGVLTLPSVLVEGRYQDSGEYVCTASNGITGKDGNKQQTGYGYLTVNAKPAFTSSNKDTEYGEYRKDVDIHVYVYSVPKFKTVEWYKSTTKISQGSKYILSEASVKVTDTFHGKEVQVDGYRLTLTIKDLLELDLNVNYSVKLSSTIVDLTTVHSILLLSDTASQTGSASVGPIIGGVAGGMGALLMFIVIVWIVMVKRKQEGLQHNILHQSACSDSKPIVLEAESEKRIQKPSTSNTDYVEVQTPNVDVDNMKNAKGKKQKAWNNSKDGEYANSSVSSTDIREREVVDLGDKNGSATNNKNQQCLEYADLSFTEQIPHKSNKLVIRGGDGRTLYTEVDYTKKAPPPPQESAYEETNFKQ